MKQTNRSRQPFVARASLSSAFAHVKQAGVSLVELMIALVLGSVLSVAIVQLFVANSETYNLLQGQSRMQESARFALSFIGGSIRKAGYRGCMSASDAVSTTLVNWDAVPYEFDLQQGVEGYNGAAGGAWSPSLAALPATIGGVDTNVFATPAGVGASAGVDTDAVIPGTDVLTLRNISQNEQRVSANMSNSTLPVTIGTPVSWGYVLDELVMIYDCEKGSVFRITNIQIGVPTATESTISHGIASVDATRNSDPRLTTIDTYQTDAAVSAIETNVFFIAPGAGLNKSGNAPLSLWRKSGLNAPVELVEGVENLQVLFGVDVDEDGTPNRYTQAPIADWTTVRTVRVTIVANSIDPVGGTSMPSHGCEVQDCVDGDADGTRDELIRRAFTQTFHLRNRG